MSPTTKSPHGSVLTVTSLWTGIASSLRVGRDVAAGGHKQWRGAWLRERVERDWPHRTRGAPHDLAAPLIVSLTSFPPRFATLHLTLKTLLLQSVRADCIALWIARDDLDQLPDAVRGLASEGVEILGTRDLRSFKKIVPSIETWPEAFLVTADDDVFYPSTWLADLLAARTDAQEIACHRAHKIRLNENGLPAPYGRWEHDTAELDASPLIYQTGVGGSLFPPGALHEEATNAAIFQELCPTNDDAWLHWMARLNGWQFRKIGPPGDFVSWPNTQSTSLRRENKGGRNDIQIQNLILRYGFPPGAVLSEAPAATVETELRHDARGRD